MADGEGVSSLRWQICFFGISIGKAFRAHQLFASEKCHCFVS
jgi:hypothetical protein